MPLFLDEGEAIIAYIKNVWTEDRSFGYSKHTCTSDCGRTP